MKLRTFLTSAVAAAAALAFTALPPWRKPRTRANTACRWCSAPPSLGQGRRAVGQQSARAHQWPHQHQAVPGVSLIQGDQTREFSALRQGVIDMAVGSTINWSPQVKQLNLFSLPFLFPDYAAVDAVTQGDVGKQIFATLDKAGVVPLAWGENGYREISNSKSGHQEPGRPQGPEDPRGGLALFLDTFTALGANPRKMSWADAQPAFASGAVDGQENPHRRVPGRQTAHRGAEAHHHVGLRERPAGVRGEQGHLEQLDARRPRDREASRH